MFTTAFETAYFWKKKSLSQLCHKYLKMKLEICVS